VEVITTYKEFLKTVDELGCLAFSNILDGLPTLWDHTSESHWFTGAQDTDPWIWRRRAVEEKKLAFGCLLGGHKAFIAPRLYPLFFTAYRPSESLEDRWESGRLAQIVWQVWQLFAEYPILSTSDMRHATGVTRKKGGSRLDSAIGELQSEFFIAVCGSEQKRDRKGNPYGWHENLYCKVEDWAPPEWRVKPPGLNRREARLMVLDTLLQQNSQIDALRLARKIDF
jgi:hypothetical protein